MAHLDPAVLEALNTLLQDTRASVEVEVALSTGATEWSEREALAAMGSEEVTFCCALHERLEAIGGPVTRHVNGIVLDIIGAEQYDDRLYAFAAHLKESGERARELRELEGDSPLGQLLEDLYDAHMRSALWCEHRASQFAHSRTLEFRTGGQATSENPLDANESDAASPDQ